MADKKISALTAASTPLAGTEVLPIVQSGSTVKVAVSDLTAGRDISASGGTFTKAGVTQVTIANTTGTTKNTQLIFADNVGSKWRIGMDVFTNNNTNELQVYSDTAGTSPFSIDTSSNVKLPVGNLIIGTSGKGIDFSATPGTGTSELFADYEEGTWTPVGNGITYSTAIGTYTKIGRLVYLSFNITFPATANASSATMSGIPFSNGTNSAGGGGYRYSTAGQYFTMAAGASDITFFDFTGNQPTNASLSTKQIQGFVEYTV